MFVVLGHPGFNIDDQLCGCMIRSAAMCLEHSGKERSRVVTQSPPNGESAAGQIS